MSEKILVPTLGESITEATVAKWLKNKGDSVESDEPIVELETDKVNLEVPSPVDGVLSEINVNDGQIVEVGATLGTVTQGDVQTTKNLSVLDLAPGADPIRLTVYSTTALKEIGEIKSPHLELMVSMNWKQKQQIR